MGLFENYIKQKESSKNWKITELSNSIKFSIGSVVEFIEIDELLGRGEAFQDKDNDFSFYKLINKLEGIVPKFKGIDYLGCTMVRIREGNPGLLLKKDEREVDFVSDRSLKTMTVIHVMEKIKQLKDSKHFDALESHESTKIDYQSHECGSKKQFGLPSPSTTEPVQH